MNNCFFENSFELGGLTLSLPGRYAKALFDLTQEQNITKDILKNFENLSNILSQSTDLTGIFHSKAIERKDQSNLIKKLGEILSLSSVFVDFLSKLAENRRLEFFKEIYDVFKVFCNQLTLSRPISVFSAYSLTAPQKKKLEEILKNCFSGELKIDFSLDASLIGGILIREGDRVIDVSLRSQFNQLATIMKGTA